MKDLKARVHAMSMDFPSRDAGSRGEELASEAISDELYDLGLRIDVDGFSCPGNIRISRSIYMALVAIGGALLFFKPGMVVAGLVLSIVGLALIYLSYNGNDPLKKVFSRYRSQNVIGRYVPEGMDGGSRRSKVVITAHYDVKKPSFFQMPALRGAWKAISMIIMVAAILVPVCCILYMLPLPGIVDTVLAWIALVAAIIVVIEILDQLVGSFLKTPKGANSNASGLAVMMELAKKIATVDVRVPSELDDDYGYGYGYDDYDDGYGYDDYDDGFAYDDADDQAVAYAVSGRRHKEIHTGLESVLQDWKGVDKEDTLPPGEVDVPVEFGDEAEGYVASDGKGAGAAAVAVGAAAGAAGVAVAFGSAAKQAEDAAAVEAPIVDRGVGSTQDVRSGRVIPRASSASQVPADGPSTVSDEAVSSQAGLQTSDGPDAALAQAAESAPRAESKKPSWWTKVEDERKRGDFDKKGEEPLTLRSRFADAPAATEFDSEGEAIVSAQEEQVETPADVDASAESAMQEDGVQAVQTAQAAQAAQADSGAAADASADSSQQVLEDDGVEPKRMVVSFGSEGADAVAAPAAEGVASAAASQTSEAKSSKLSSVKIPAVEDEAIPFSTPESTVAYTPRPVSEILSELDEGVMSMPQQHPERAPMPDRPEPYQEPLVSPEGESSAAWPTGSYQYSRNQNKYRPDDEPQPSYDGIAEGQSGVLDFSRGRYEDEFVQGAARSDAGQSQQSRYDDEISLDEASNAALDSLFDDAPSQAAGSAYAGRVPDVPRSDNPAAYSTLSASQDAQQAERSGSNGGRSSLLNLPIVGASSIDPNKSVAGIGQQTGLDMSDTSSDDLFIAREDEVSSANLTGAFAPLSTSGLMQPVTAEMLEQYNDGETMYVEDAADSYDNFYSSEGSYAADLEIDMPKRGLRRKSKKVRKKSRRGRKGDETQSANEWLGVDADYNATNEGAKIGSWDNFSDGYTSDSFDPDYNGDLYAGTDAYGNSYDDQSVDKTSVWDSWSDYEDDGDDSDGFDTYWRGGAYGGGTPEQNRDAVAALSDELLNKEVWFVALGASDADSAGMDNLLRTHGSELKRARIINIESIGAGKLSCTSSEKVLFQNRKVDSRMQKLVSKSAKAAGVKVGQVEFGRSTEATRAISKHKRAITITAVDDKGLTPGWKWGDDTDELISEGNLEAALRLMTEIVKNC